MQPAACLNVAISEHEIRKALGDALIGLHNGCAKGVQGLPAELLCYAKLEPSPEKPPPVIGLTPILTMVLNAAYEMDFIPTEVNGGLVTPVFKKGDPLCSDNYRPIAVTAPIMRLYAKDQ